MACDCFFHEACAGPESVACWKSLYGAGKKILIKEIRELYPFLRKKDADTIVTIGLKILKECLVRTLILPCAR